jgi:hypothetical protein
LLFLRSARQLFQLGDDRSVRFALEVECCGNGEGDLETSVYSTELSALTERRLAWAARTALSVENTGAKSSGMGNDPR